MAILTKAVRASGGDYTTWAAWEAACSADLVSDGDLWRGEGYDEAYDEQNITLAGTTTDATHYKEMVPASGEEHDGTAGTGPRIVGSSLAQADDGIVIDEQYARVVGIEVGPLTGSNASGGVSSGIVCLDNSGGHVVARCIIHGIDISRSNRGLNQNNGGISGLTFVNNIIYDIQPQGAGNAAGLLTWGNSAETHDVHGNTVYNAANFGFKLDVGSGQTAFVGNYKNNISMGSGVLDFVYPANGTVNTDANLSSDASADDNGDGTHQTSKTTSNQFVSLTGGSEDLHLKSGSDAEGNGVDLGTSPALVNVDIDGFDRDSIAVTWDIGAHQFVTSVSQTVTPSPISMALGVQAPTVAVGATSVSPTPTAMALGVQAPAVSVGAMVVTPTPIAMALGIQAPAVAAGAVGITPTPIPMTLAIATPAVSSGAQFITPDAIAMALGIQAPSISMGAATVTPSAIAMALGVQSPSLSMGATSVSPAPIVMVLGVQAPSVTDGGVITVTPAAIAMALGIQSPSLTMGPTAVTPTPIALALSVQAPVVAVGAIQVTPTPIGLLLSIQAPSLSTGPTTVTPTPIAMQLVVVSPLVVGGQVLAGFSGQLLSLAPFATGRLVGVPAHGGVILSLPAHQGEITRDPN